MSTHTLTRRDFLASAAAVTAAPTILGAAMAQPAAAPDSTPANKPQLLDLHVHLDNSTLDEVLALSEQQGIRYGIVEHAGTKENVYPVVLSNDEELLAYVARFKGKPAFKGVQAEWTDWASCFSEDALSHLDYVLTDAMTMPGDGPGKRQKLWEADAAYFGEAQAWMDRYVDWHVQIMEQQPIDIFANLTWLPEVFAADYDTLWTEPRMTRIIESAVKNHVALEISGSFNVPRLPFVKMAKDAGAQFTFGSNGRYPKMGQLDYAVQLAAEAGLTAAHMFVPDGHGPKGARRA